MAAESHVVKILAAENVTHDVRRFVVEKPEGYAFEPGQATEVSINKEGWKEELRPFTFTSLNANPNLEFTIKIYKDHEGVTNELSKLERGDELIIHDVWGTIHYDGPGYFIAGGAGITPFIAILRQLEKDGKLGDNHLIFGNKTQEDIILNGTFTRMLGDNFSNVLSDEKVEGYGHGFVDKNFLQEKVTDFKKNFYVCGPKPMQKAVMDQLKELGAEPTEIVFEK